MNNPVPDQFEVADFLPDEDQLLAPLGDLAVVPDNDVLHFVLIKRKAGSMSSPWTVPDRAEFDGLVNDATQHALTEDCLTPFSWADPKWGNITLYAASRLGLEHFREVICSIAPSNAEYQYETYLWESVVQKYSITIMLRTNLAGIQNDALAPVLFKRNRYLRDPYGSLRSSSSLKRIVTPSASPGQAGAYSTWKLIQTSFVLSNHSPRITSSPWALRVSLFGGGPAHVPGRRTSQSNRLPPSGILCDPSAAVHLPLPPTHRLPSLSPTLPL